MIYVCILLMASLMVLGAFYVKLAMEFKHLQGRITWVEEFYEQIDVMMALQTDLSRFGKANLELRRLDPSGIFYREPVK